MCDSEGKRRRRQELVAIAPVYLFGRIMECFIVYNSMHLQKETVFFSFRWRKCQITCFRSDFLAANGKRWCSGSAIINLRFMQRRHISGFLFVDHLMKKCAKLADFESNRTHLDSVGKLHLTWHRRSFLCTLFLLLIKSNLLGTVS